MLEVVKNYKMNLKKQQIKHEYEIKEHEAEIRELELKLKHEQELKNIETQSKAELTKILMNLSLNFNKNVNYFIYKNI